MSKSKTMPKSLFRWLEPRLRRLSLYWPGKTIAREIAKVYVSDGFHKNGKEKFVTRFICAECARQEINPPYHVKENTQMDHINPAVKLEGFESWDEYLPSLFANPEGYQCLCVDHHQTKTQKENVQRKKNRQKS